MSWPRTRKSRRALLCAIPTAPALVAWAVLSWHTLFYVVWALAVGVLCVALAVGGIIAWVCVADLIEGWIERGEV